MNRWTIGLLPLFLTAFISHAADSNSSAFADAPVQTNAITPSSFTIDGFTYENVRWGRITPSTATIFHKTGVATIPLGKFPPEWQEKLGYDPFKAKQYRRAEAEAKAAWLQAKQQRLELLQQRQAEEDQRRKFEATAVDFHCTIMALDERGVVVRTAKTSIPYSATIPASGSVEDRPKQIEITYAFLVGHPRQASLVVGDTVSCRAYRDGSQETDGEPLPRWVYLSEAHHPIPPPPPP
jgi:hypothetical protein